MEKVFPFLLQVCKYIYYEYIYIYKLYIIHIYIYICSAILEDPSSVSVYSLGIPCVSSKHLRNVMLQPTDRVAQEGCPRGHLLTCRGSEGGRFPPKVIEVSFAFMDGMDLAAAIESKKTCTSIYLNHSKSQSIV